MKKQLSFILSFLILFAVVAPHQTFAHFAKSDGDISVTLHVDPNDDPTPGKQANLYFLFEDTTNRFQLEKCACTVVISQQGKQIFQQKLIEKKSAHPSIWGTNMPYVFPQKDVYHITLTGTPLTATTFQPFTLSWDFRVDPDGSPGLVTDGPSDIQVIVLLTLGGVVFFTLLGWFIKKEILDAETVDSGKKSQYTKKR